jgi:hypothetical protein
MTWLLTSQALLFAAYGTTISVEFSNSCNVGLWALLGMPNLQPSPCNEKLEFIRYILIFVGLLLSTIIYIAIYSAVKSLHRLADKWYTHAADRASNYPPITGNSTLLSRQGLAFDLFSIRIAPIIFGITWTAVAWKEYIIAQKPTLHYNPLIYWIFLQACWVVFCVVITYIANLWHPPEP